MKLLVTGALGQLGFDVVQEGKHRCIDVLPTDYMPSNEFKNYTQLDITDNKGQKTLLKRVTKFHNPIGYSLYLLCQR